MGWHWGILNGSGGDTSAYITGGTLYQGGGYNYRVFTASGTMTVNQAVATEILVISGGGGGARGGTSAGGGGGGAAGVNYTTHSYSTGSYTVTIGAGGASENTGSASSIALTSSTYAPDGRGVHARYNNVGLNGIATNGSASGNQGGYTATIPTGSGTGGDGGKGGPGSGNDGGGGGGGAGGDGANGSSVTPNGGNGGIGTSSYSSWLSTIGVLGELSGGTYYIAAGGGGGPGSGAAAAGGGGIGGGGDGDESGGSNGLANSGSGGGGYLGSTVISFAKGGSGVVIVRWAA